MNIYNIDAQHKFDKDKVNQFPIVLGQPLISQASPSRSARAQLLSLPNKKDPSKNKQVLELYEQEELVWSLNLDDYHETIVNNVV